MERKWAPGAERRKTIAWEGDPGCERLGRSVAACRGRWVGGGGTRLGDAGGGGGGAGGLLLVEGVQEGGEALGQGPQRSVVPAGGPKGIGAPLGRPTGRGASDG